MGSLMSKRSSEDPEDEQMNDSITLEDDKNDYDDEILEKDLQDIKVLDYETVEEMNIGNERDVIDEEKQIFQCDQCGKKYKYKKGLKYHERQKHEKPMKGAQRPRERNDSKKVISMGSSKPKRSSEDTEDEQMNDSITLEDDKTDYDDEILEKDQQETEILDYETVEEMIIDNERDVIDEEKQIFQCDQCGKKYKYKKGLKHHERQKHHETQKHENPMKGAQRKRPRERNDSIKIDREDVADELFQCSKCSKKFSRKSHLIRHLIVHTKKKAFQCGTCKKSYFYKESLAKHMASKRH